MTAASYDEIASWYDEVIRTGPQSLIHDLVIPTVLDLAGDVEGRRICDLACGQGVVARMLAERGAEVHGVDVSEKLLDIARGHERAMLLGISYSRDDAQSLGSISDASFDGVVCNLALMDIPDLTACLRAVVRILCPGGWFVFSITHSCFQAPNPQWTQEGAGSSDVESAGYFAEGFWRSDNPEGIRGKAGTWHRTLSSYTNALADAGLVIERLAEPRAGGVLASRFPRYLEVPAILISRCRKLAGTSF